MKEKRKEEYRRVGRMRRSEEEVWLFGEVRAGSQVDRC